MSCSDPGNVMRYSRLVTWASDGLLRQEPPVTKLNTCMDDTRAQPEDNGIVSAPSRDCRMSMAPSASPRSAGHILLVEDDAELSRRSEEHTSELQSLMRSSYAVFCL